MFSQRIDMTGGVYGRLTVLRFSHSHKTKSGKSVAMWWARCECGDERAYRGASLRSGNTSSCGCLNKERSAAAAKKRHTTHGMTDTPTWRSWKSMRDRCLNPSHKSFQRYGKLTICSEWVDSFEAFYAAMGDRPDGTTLERIDNEKGYLPENCRWATPKEQAQNTRSNRYVSAHGQELLISEWAEKNGVGADTIYLRLKRGWSPERAVAAGDFRVADGLADSFVAESLSEH
jgi:hypothetical protein